jgi:hypothetical protein
LKFCDGLHTKSFLQYFGIAALVFGWAQPRHQRNRDCWLDSATAKA